MQATTVELDQHARLWHWQDVLGENASTLLHTLTAELPWQHALPVSLGVHDPRINLTFRLNYRKQVNGVDQPAIWLRLSSGRGSSTP